MTAELGGRVRRQHGIDIDDPALEAFWRQRLLCSLTTLRASGLPHVVPVGATLDVPARLARVITSGESVKAGHVRRAQQSGALAPVAICQLDGRHWCTIEGRATLLTDPGSVAEAERRYAERYRTPRINPSRVVLAVRIERILGSLPG